MPQDNEREQFEKLIAIIQEALQKDEQLRQTYQMGEKFRFIRDRLQGLLESIQKDTVVREKKVSIRQEVKIEEDDCLVYVHLYNAQGAVVRTWQAMITPKAFFDFSVNRPIYLDQAQVAAFVRSKSNKVQHAYLTIAMKRDRILPIKEEAVKDSLGNALIKVKEGALTYERMVSFTHNEHTYTLNSEGELVKQ